jgi:hypothetical protein
VTSVMGPFPAQWGRPPAMGTDPATVRARARWIDAHERTAGDGDPGDDATMPCPTCTVGDCPTCNGAGRIVKQWPDDADDGSVGGRSLPPDVLQRILETRAWDPDLYVKIIHKAMGQP